MAHPGIYIYPRRRVLWELWETRRVFQAARWNRGAISKALWKTWGKDGDEARKSDQVFHRAGHLSIMLCPGASFRLESCLEQGIELVERGPDGGGDSVPLPGLEGGDDNAQFEFRGLFGMEVPAAVTTQNLELFIDGLDGVGR